jgi:hypothetical protein
MGCHLGWHFAVCCPLRGGRGVFIKKTPKTIKEKKRKLICKDSVDEILFYLHY